MSPRELVQGVVVVVVMGTERVREAHQSAQGASELGVRMLEYPAVHAEVKTRRGGEAVWLNMQSEESEEEEEEEGKKDRFPAATARCVQGPGCKVCVQRPGC